MSIKLLTEHHLEFLSLKGGCTDLSESIYVKLPHCWKSHVVAHLLITIIVAADGLANTVSLKCYVIKERYSRFV